jgi:UDP-glucose 4-epimerase
VLPGARLVQADIGNARAMARLLADGPWDAVFHFAGLALAGESMRVPFRYLIENAAASIRLIEACVRHQVRRFVFSSSAALYAAQDAPIEEDGMIEPGTPYGESKWMIERALYWADRVCGLRCAVLRYFNAAGADPEGRLGEDHRPETHLIPLAIDAALGRRPVLDVYGDDYPTPDGTCIRDYMHVTDLARLHLLALDRLRFGSVAYNVGSGEGHSVLEVIAAVERVTGLRVPYRMAPRRPGDPPTLVASATRALHETSWQPRFPTLDDSVRTAFAWRLAHPRGYDDIQHGPRPDGAI